MKTSVLMDAAEGIALFCGAFAVLYGLAFWGFMVITAFYYGVTGQ